VLDNDIPYTSFPDAVRELFGRDKHSVVVTGTHGKTTTTSLLGWILTHAGLDPTVLIGGISENFGTSFRLGEGEHFVIEGDEYDTAFFDKTPKFMHYDARTLIFTSCEFDHADIYASLDEIRAAFGQLVAGLPADGCIVAAIDDDTVQRVLARSPAPVQGYGFTDQAQWRASDVTFDHEGTQFNIWNGEERMARVKVPMFGRHNVENVLGAVATAAELGVDPEASALALAEFQGVRRRQQLHGEAAGMVVIEDFAHHPTAVRETLAAMRARFPARRLWAVLEPRTNTSRRRTFEEDFIEALSAADGAVIAGVHRAEQIPEDERLRPDRIAEELRSREVDAASIADIDAIIEHLVQKRSGADIALIMSNGAFGGIWERLLARLRKETA
jgi:UDP-N-acetylmuramate: L-alanyl-gamma-D-glutamyl-meso-diaminopimelate ligase